MANSEKHKKSLTGEWLEAEDNLVPTHSRSSHVLGSYIKIEKPAARKFRQPLPEQKPAKTETALVRDPAPPLKLPSNNSQSASWEHQRKLERLPKLRAPYQYKSR